MKKFILLPIYIFAIADLSAYPNPSSPYEPSANQTSYGQNPQNYNQNFNTGSEAGNYSQRQNAYGSQYNQSPLNQNRNQDSRNMGSYNNYSNPQNNPTGDYRQGYSNPNQNYSNPDSNYQDNNFNNRDLKRSEDSIRTPYGNLQAANDQYTPNQLKDQHPNYSSNAQKTLPNDTHPHAHDRYTTEKDHEINMQIREKITGWFTDDYKTITINTNNGHTVIEGYVDNADNLSYLTQTLKKYFPEAVIKVQVKPYNKP